MVVNDITLSPEQADAIDQVSTWFKDGGQILTLGGYAGTGKTTLIKEIVTKFPHVAIVAYTGKAVSVLQRKGVKQAQTLHSLVYRIAGENDDGDPIFKRQVAIENRMVIVDEASMINERMHNDLEMLANKILYVGDHGQLEPIGYDPGLMHDPVIRLEKIHRQAEGSQILTYAHHLREGGDPIDLPWGAPQYGEHVTIDNRWPNDIHLYDVILVGFNGQRHYLNKVVREKRGYAGIVPNPGETVICLQNNRNLGIFNGLLVEVERCEQHDEQIAYLSWTDFEGYKRETPIYLPQFGTSEKFQREEPIRERLGLFDWGYALTVHKAQGSEWDRVCVIEGIHESWSPERWRYTAVTRAAQDLTYITEKRKLPWKGRERKGLRRKKR